MQHIKFSVFTITLICAVLLVASSSSMALDANPRVQDRYSSPSTGKIISPSSSSRENVTKKQPTTDQKFTTIFSKLATLEQTVTTLRNQVNVQAQLIAQLRQVIAVHFSGVVTIQAPGTLNINAGGNLNMSGSTVDVKAAIAGVHGMLKANTMLTTTITSQSYSPGAGNIW